MNDGTNIHQAGVQINFPTWERFKLETLSSDGVLLFQYLAFHCQHNAQWTHSDKSLEYELGIGRRRLEALRKLFVGMGILETHITRDRNDNRIRAYRIDFAELTKLPILKQVYRDQDDKGEPIDLTTYVQIYRTIAAAQPKLGTTKREKLQQAQKETVIKGIANQMVDIFNERRKLYNAKIEKASTPTKKLRIAVGSVKFSQKHLRQLANAIRAIDDNPFILKAFTAYCDTLNAHTNTPNQEERLLLKEAPRDPLAYFLTYSTGVHNDSNLATDGQAFNVIYAFGNYLASKYSREL